MTKELSRQTMAGLAIVSIILVPAYFFWPLLTITFEAGLLAGIFFHSAHSYPVDTDSNDWQNEKKL
jgi:hypothetical protein